MKAAQLKLPLPPAKKRFVGHKRGKILMAKMVADVLAHIERLK